MELKSTLRTGLRLLRSSETRADVGWEWRRRLRGPPDLPSAVPRRILVVCKGNLCRSPFAEHLLAARAKDVCVSSAGLHAANGHPAEPGALAMAPEFGIRLDGHLTSKVSDEGIRRADLVVAFTGWHAREISNRWPEVTSRILLLGDLLASPPYAIEDPWGEPEEVFRSVYRRIDLAVDALIEKMGRAS